MNWRQLLDRLPISIVKRLNIEATREAQRCYDTYLFRCFQCETYLREESVGQLEACIAAENKGWGAQNTSKHPNFIRLIWFCPKCKEAKDGV